MTDYTIQSGTSGTFTVDNGDTLTVAFGGVSSQSVINTGGTETAGGPGFASIGDIIRGGTAFLGSATQTVISSGFVAVQGLLDGATQTGGTVFVSGQVQSSVMSGGSVLVSSGGQITAETVSGGTLSISGGVAFNTVVLAGGAEQVFTGGVDNAATVAGQQFVNSGGTANVVQVLAGGTQTVLAGGQANGAVVAGTQTISGGSVLNTEIDAGGTQTVDAGAATGDVISAGGIVTVMTGGAVNGASVAAGGELTLQGGTAVGSIVNDGDLTFAYGTSNTFTGALSGGGTVTVGGTATVVLAGSNTGSGTTTIGYGGSLELTSGGAAGTGAINFAGGTGTLIIDGDAPTNVITGVLPYGTNNIVLRNLNGANATITQTNGDFVTVTAGDVTDVLNIAGSGNSSFSGTTTNGVFQLTEQAACFLRGGRIAVPGGEVAVETLRAGDLVLLEGGAAVAVTWVGTGSGTVTDANRCDIAPVVVRAGALADGVPHRDLRLTRRHGVRVGGVLVPVELLVNDRSVVWDDAAGAIEVFHVEIEGHGILLAEGAPAESFRDDGSAHLFTDTAGRSGGKVAPCLPLVTGGPALEQAWRAVAARAGALPDDSVTTDPALHIEQGGQRVAAFAVRDGAYRFRLPRPGMDIVLHSRSVIPASLGGSDERRLGVALTGLEAGGRRLGADLLEAGVHGMEGGHRWTKGRAVLPASLLGEDAAELVVHVAATLPYRASLALTP